MTPEEFEVVRDALIMAGTIPTETAVAVRDSLLILLRRDWSVRVLVHHHRAQGHVYALIPVLPGVTDDVAHVVFKSLPDDVRADLGECP